MDWYSRKVLAWRLSNTLDAQFCVDALKEAIDLYGLPEIFNTDQGGVVCGKVQKLGFEFSDDFFSPFIKSCENNMFPSQRGEMR